MRMEEAVKERILVLDGAMGTMIQQYGLTEDDFRGERFANSETLVKGNNDMLNITRPDIIEDIHRRYLAAGADIITTNTFSSQRISQADYRLENVAREMALEGARIARRVADEYSTPQKPRWVAGSIGPTNKTCSMSPSVDDPSVRDIDYDILYEAYHEQADALVEGRVDALLIETIFDTLNAKAAIAAGMDIMKERGVSLPIMLSVTVSDKAGRTLCGQTLQAFMASVADYPIFSLGLNCSFGARRMKEYIKEIAAYSPWFVSAYPNAGLPNSLGFYDETPESMASQMKEYVDEGLVNIIGGCCGTTEKFIEKYIPLVEGKHPRQRNPRPSTLQLSGLDVLSVDETGDFITVGERCNVAGSRKFLRLIGEKNYAEAMAIARKQVEAGAQVIDINMDDALLDAQIEMCTFLKLIAAEPDVARVPVMIDSSDWRVIEAALKCVQGKCIVNSISLKEGEDVFVRRAQTLMRYGAAVVVMCFDENGQATTYERRIEIAARAYKILTENVGMQPQNIIFDPNILTISTGMEEHDNYAKDFILATGWIRNNLPGAHVSGGVSNLSFAFRGNNYIREAMHCVFIHHAMQSGMDFAIINPTSKATYENIPQELLKAIEDVIFNRYKGASDALIVLAEARKAEEEAARQQTADVATKQKTAVSAGKQSIDERLADAIVKGIDDHLESDLTEAMTKYGSAVKIIEGPLMEGMNTVGTLFGSGQMFLPQVIKAARTMKRAVAILEPFFNDASQTTTKKAGKVLLATVKGDVHDIGKNIVGVIMACNNYEIIDLGVMVSAEEIVCKAVEEQVDIVGLSGLITPSLDEMANVVRQMAARGLTIPIMIGGATTSEMHVALKLAPLYDGVVVWMKDASQNALVAPKLSDKEALEVLKHELDTKYAALQQSYKERQEGLCSLEEARKRKPNLFD